MNWKRTARYGVIGAAVLVFGLGVFEKGNAGGVTPGSQSDPLVTQSYVDNYVKLQVLELSPGDRLILHEGAEVILRSGKATAVGSARGGLSDVTKGVDLNTGATVPTNHLLIIPLSDGRGLTAGTHAFVMVRGGFDIQPAGTKR